MRSEFAMNHHPGEGGMTILVISSGALGVVTSILSVFLLGTLGLYVGEDLSISPGIIGAALSAFYAGAAVGGHLCGRLTLRFRPTKLILVGVCTAGTVMIATGILAQGIASLLALMSCAGIAMGVTDPAVAARFVEALANSRWGLAFGLKEAAIPAATMLASLTVPLVAGALSWRTAFVAMGAILPAITCVTLYLSRPPDHAPRSSELGAAVGPHSRRADAASFPATPLILVAVGVGFSVGAAKSMAAFSVPFLTTSGVPASSAGWALAIGSVLCICVRATSGVLADHRSVEPYVVVGMMVVGGAGLLAFTVVEDSPIILSLAVIACMGVGWGWPGLVFLLATRAAPRLAGRAAAIILVGLTLGGVVGPYMFGLLVDISDVFSAAWLAAGVSMLVGALLVRQGFLRVRA